MGRAEVIAERGSEGTTWVGRWARRSVSISLFFSLWALCWASFPLLLVLALVLDGIRRRRLATTRTLLFFALFLGCEVAGIVASFGLWIWRLGCDHERYLRANFDLQRWWASTLRRGAFRIFSLELEVDGAEVCQPGPLILCVRHVSVADTMLPVLLVSEPHDIVLRWVMKRELLWDPCLDIVGHRLKNCFVSRMPDEGAEDVAAVAALMDDLAADEGVVIYPEGTRFTPAKRARVLAKLADKGARARLDRARSLTHSLPPRLGGLLALLEHNAGADVVFCAHRGLEGAATFADLWHGRIVGQRVSIALWRVPFADVPVVTSDRIAWIHEHWRRIDDFAAGRGV